MSTPLLDLVTVVPGVDTGVVTPFEISTADNEADEVAEGDTKPESELTFTAGSATVLPVIAHHVPVLLATLKHSPMLRAVVDTFLANGLLAKVEAAVVAELIANAGVASLPFDTDVPTTVRNAVAAAEAAQPELGGSEVAVVLSPADHAALDLEGLNLREWPCQITSSPRLTDGTAFVGRLRQAVEVTAGVVRVAAGTVGTQFVQNRLTLLAEVEALPVVTAPGVVFEVNTGGS